MGITLKIKALKWFTLLLIIVFSCSFIQISAQPVASFHTKVGTNETDAGCEDVTFSFINTTSNCNGTATYQWDFDDGRVSSETSPVLSFPVSGTYNVSLTVTCDNGTDQVVIPIYIYSNPVADFYADELTGCVPHTVEFTDNSTAGDGTIETHVWYFGDGNSDNGANPENIYTTSNEFNVRLSVIDEHGCQDTITRLSYISVANNPFVDFFADSTETCEPPLTVNFTSNITTSFGLDYDVFWDFDDGSNSVQENPQKIFGNGVYDISLTVTDEYSCETVLIKEEYIRVDEPIADYQILTGSTIVDGNILCRGDVYYFENLTGYSSNWTFPGMPPTSANPASTVFNNGGDVTVYLTLDPGGNCETIEPINLFVEEVSASFTTIPEPNPDIFSCSTPFDVQFFDGSSENTVSYFYVFADGGTSDQANPIHTFNSPGVFIPTLTATTANNCSHTFLGPQVRIVSPHALFTVNPGEGCSPLEIFVEYNGTTPVGSITNFKWDFGDGYIINSGSESETHIYTSPGEYEIILTITDNEDCLGTYSFDITVGDVYEPEFDVVTYEDHLPLPNNYLCAQDTVELYLAEFAMPGFEDFEFTWWIDSINNVVNNEYMEWQFDQDTGWITIHMITNNNGCRDTLIWDSVYISGPIITNIEQSYLCENTLEYEFNVEAIIGDRFDWYAYEIIADERVPYDDYLDTEDTEWGVIFPYSGEYWVQVIAYSDTTGCEFIDSIQVITTNLQAVLDFDDDVVCVDVPIILDASDSNDATSYMWDMGDGFVTEWLNDEIFEYSYLNSGDFVITLSVRDSQGCIDTVMRNVSVLGAEIQIMPDVPVYGCNTLTVNFSDHSLPSGNIQFVQWDFGDGALGSGFDVSHTYTTPGIYSVVVTVGTLDGCPPVTKVFENWVEVLEISAGFSTDNNIACAGVDVALFSELDNPLFEYSWDFGDGNSSNVQNPIHQYSQGGIYDVTLSLTDGFDCNESLTIQGFFIIEEAVADFSLEDDVIACWPADPGIISNVQVLPEGTGASYWWDMGDGGVSEVPNPDYLYYAPGDYTISLLLTTANGCTATHSEDLHVQGPYAEAIVSDTIVCLGDEVTFEIENQDGVESFMWIFDDGSTSTQEVAVHTYNLVPLGGYFNAKLEITAGECSPQIPIRIWIFDLNAEFTITDVNGLDEFYAACNPFDAKFNSISENDEYRFWYVDDQEIGSGLVSEDYTFTNDTEENFESIVTLIIEDNNGCRDTAELSFNIYFSPDISISNDTLICLGDEITITTSGGANYTWSPDYNINNVNLQSPTVNPEENTVYYVEVRTEDNCSDIDSIEITIQFPPEVAVFPDIDTILIGDTLFISHTANQENLSFLWTPQSFISCSNCPEPYFYPEQSTRYVLTVRDSLQCFRYNYFVDVTVIERYALDLPSAFTPLGHESNQIVFVKGFGIRKLLQFRIYNRWGEEVFFTDDINQGWDGYYKGQLQNIDTYVYYVEAEMYDGTIQTKKGNILLMR
jgi:gliding motility-associated-like protein